jgi:predicted ATPase
MCRSVAGCCRQRPRCPAGPVESIAALPVLFVATYRPEFQPPWVGGSQVTVIALNRLGRSEGARLVAQLAGNLGALPPDIVDEIVERTDGVPLFVEELTKASWLRAISPVLG